MNEAFSRSALLLTDDGIEKLRRSKVAVFGVGGVGSYTVEALARTGVGSIIIIDSDTVAESNLNRQLIALSDNIGEKKVIAAKRRIEKICHDTAVMAMDMFFLPECDCDFLKDCDYVVDAIDTVSAKLFLAKKCREMGIPLISAMGAGNKTNPYLMKCADIYDTSVCPLCRVMRRELRKAEIDSLKVVYSEEPPKNPPSSGERKPTPGSLCFVTGTAGLMIAGEVIKDLIK